MLGLDKKAVDKLKKLRDLDGLSGPHRDIITSMLEKCLDPGLALFHVGPAPAYRRPACDLCGATISQGQGPASADG